MLERQHLCSANSFRGPGHTYFGNVAGVKSRIDHICIPQSTLPCILSCAVTYRLGEGLQRVSGPGKRDHMPVKFVLQHQSQFSGPASNPQCVRDTSRMVDGALRGDGRSELVYQVNQRLGDTNLAQYATCSPTQPVPYPDQIGLLLGKQRVNLPVHCIRQATPWQQFKAIKVLEKLLLPSLVVVFEFATVVILTSFCQRFFLNGKHLFILTLHDTPETSYSDETSVTPWLIVLLNLMMQCKDMTRPIFENWAAPCPATKWGQNDEGMTNHRPADQKPLNGYNIFVSGGKGRRLFSARNRLGNPSTNHFCCWPHTCLYTSTCSRAGFGWLTRCFFQAPLTQITSNCAWMGRTWWNLAPFQIVSAHLADWVWDTATWTTLSFAHVRPVHVNPVVWFYTFGTESQSNFSFQIDKANRKTGRAGLRTINTFEPLGKNLCQVPMGQRCPIVSSVLGFWLHTAQVPHHPHHAPTHSQTSIASCRPGPLWFFPWRNKCFPQRCTACMWPSGWSYM